MEAEQKNVIALKMSLFLKNQYSAFILVGIICFIIDFLFLAFLVEQLHLDVLLATVVSFLIVVLINYLLSVRFVFTRGRFRLRNEVILFYLFSAVGLVLNVILMYSFVELLGIYYLTAKIITVIVISLFSFFSRKYFVFLK